MEVQIFWLKIHLKMCFFHFFQQEKQNILCV